MRNRDGLDEPEDFGPPVQQTLVRTPQEEIARYARALKAQQAMVDPLVRGLRYALRYLSKDDPARARVALEEALAASAAAGANTDPREST